MHHCLVLVVCGVGFVNVEGMYADEYVVEDLYGQPTFALLAVL